MAHFQDVNSKVSNVWCGEVIETKKPYIIPASNWHDSFQLTVELCTYLLIPKYEITLKLRKYALGKTAN